MVLQDKLAKAAQIRRQYDSRLQTIRQDRNLSALGRQQLIKAEYERASEAIRSLRAEAEAEREQERRELQRRAFGVPYSSTATPAERAQMAENYRAAIDRAEATKSPAEALALLKRADRTGDTDLARAVAAVAAERAWNGVVNEYAALDPSAHDAIAALQAFVLGDTTEAAFRRRVALAGPMRPPELDRPLPPEEA